MRIRGGTIINSTKVNSYDMNQRMMKLPMNYIRFLIKTEMLSLAALYTTEVSLLILLMSSPLLFVSQNSTSLVKNEEKSSFRSYNMTSSPSKSKAQTLMKEKTLEITPKTMNANAILLKEQFWISFNNHLQKVIKQKIHKFLLQI